MAWLGSDPWVGSEAWNEYGVFFPADLVSSSSFKTSAASGAIPRPDNVVAGNLLVVVLYNANSLAVTTFPAGWTRSYFSAGDPQDAFQIWTKVATASEPASYTITTNAYWAAVILQFFNADEIDINPVSTGASGGNPATSGAAATAGPSRKHYVAFGGYTGAAWTTPSGLSLIQSPRTAGDVSMFLFEGTTIDSGSSPTYQSTQSVNVDRWRTLSFLIVPSTGGGPSGVIGTSALTASTPTLSGAGTLNVSGSGTLTASASSLSGTGVVQTFGSGAFVSPTPNISGQASLSIIGASELIAPAPSLSGAGQIVSNTIIGSGTLVADAPTISGVGVLKLIGSGSLIAPVSNLSGAGSLRLSGSGSLVASAAKIISGQADVLILGEGSLVASSPMLSGESLLRVLGSGALAVASSILSGFGVIQLTGSGMLVADSATMFGVGEVYDASIIYEVPSSRTLTVPLENRTLVIAAENRTIKA